MRNLLCISSVLLLLMWSSCLKAQPQLRLLSNYNSIGFQVQLPQGFDADTNSTVFVTYYSATHPLDTAFMSTRLHVDTLNEFWGSLFFLDANTQYHVKVLLTDSTPSLQTWSFTDSIYTRAEPVIQATGNILYVCDTCSGNQYTLNQPGDLASLIGSGLVTCGTTVMLKGGRYDTGEMILNLHADCSENNPIVIMAFPGDTPILDGGYYQQLNWTRDNNDTDIYNAPVNSNIQYSNLCLFDSTLLYPYAFAYTPGCVPGYPSLTGLDYNVSGFVHNANSFQIKTLNHDDPNQHQLIFSKQFMCLKVNGNNKQSYLYIKGLTFKYYAKNTFTVDALFGTETSSGQSYAIALIDVNHAVVDNCRFEYCGQSVGLSGVGDYNTVQNCYSKQQTGLWEHGAFKETRDVANVYGFCLYPSSFGRYIEGGAITCLPNDNQRITGLVIRNNIIDGQVGGIGTGWENAPNSQFIETDIYNNEVFNCYDAIDNYYGHMNLRIWGNTIHNNPVSFSTLNNFYGPRYYIRNVVHHISDRTNNARDAIFFVDCSNNISSKVWGTGMKMNPDSFQAASGYVYLLHNTFHSADSLGFIMNLKNGGSRKLYMRNNIYYSEGIANFFFDGVGSESYYSFDSKNDDFFNELNGTIAFGNTLHNNSPCQFYSNTAQLDSGLRNLTGSAGIHVEGFTLAPDFRNLAVNDFHLRGTSGIIDRGSFITGVNNRNYYGNAPDIGAYEHYKVTVPVSIYDTVIQRRDSMIYHSVESNDTVTVRDTVWAEVDTSYTIAYSDTVCSHDTIALAGINSFSNADFYGTLNGPDTIFSMDTLRSTLTILQADSVIDDCVISTTDSVYVFLIATGNAAVKTPNIYFYPNPANDKFMLFVEGLEGECTLRMSDLSGRRLLERPVNSAGTAEVFSGKYPNGMYDIQIFNSGQCLAHHKIIVQH